MAGEKLKQVSRRPPPVLKYCTLIAIVHQNLRSPQEPVHPKSGEFVVDIDVDIDKGHANYDESLMMVTLLLKLLLMLW